MILSLLGPLEKAQVQVQVQVILRLTVSRPVPLGVLLLLEWVTRCHISLSDNYFPTFSCRTPSLMRGWVRNLQYNDASSSSSYIATEGPSPSLSWCRAPYNSLEKSDVLRGLLLIL
jgi:hypothetical protein